MIKENFIKAIENLAPSARALPIRLFKIVSYRWGVDDGVLHSLEETGVIFGVTRERIRQMEVKAMEIMRQVDKTLDKENKGAIIKKRSVTK